MPTRTLYVPEEDESVWEEARRLGGDESLSRLATDGLRILLAERQATAAEDSQDEAKHPDDAPAVGRFLRELRRLGWEQAGRTFTRACILYGAERSRAKRKADDTLGPEGRQAAARKAQATKGVEGRRLAARKAQNTKLARRGK